MKIQILLYLLLLCIAPSTLYSQFDWEEVGNGMWGVSVSSMAFDNHGRAVIATPHGIYSEKYNVELGITYWERVDTILISARLFQTESKIFIPDSQGLLVSDRTSLQWEQVNDVPINSYSLKVFDDSTLVWWKDRAISFSFDGGKTYRTGTGPFSQFWNIEKTSGGEFYLQRASNVVYVSKDTGRTWKYVQSFSRPGYYWGYIGIVDEIFFGVSDGNLYRSTDKGETWVQVATKQVYSIGKWVGGDIYALTYTPKRALLRSSDSGVTWTQVMEYNEWILGLSESGVLWANEEGRLYKSTDSAKSWIDLSKEFRNTNIDKLFADQRDVHIYASTLSSKRQFGSNSSLPFYRVFRSNDGGDSWVPIYEGANDVKGVDNIGNIYLSYYDTVLTTTTEPAYYTMLRTILQSNDYGTTWNEILPDVALLPYTLDTIISSPSGIVVLDFTGYDTTYRYGSRFHSPVLSVDSGRTWMRGEEWIPKEISTLLTVHARSDGTLLIPDYHPSIDQAPASFVLWKYNPSSGELIVINNLAIDHFSIGEDGNLYGFSQRGIYYSSDNGDTWDSIPSAITTTSTFNYGIYGVRVSPEGHLMIIAWPYGGDRGLYISQNRGVTWEQVPQEHPHMIEPYIQLPRYMMGNDVLIDALHFDRLKTIYSPKGAHHYYSFSWSTDNGSVWKYSDDDPLAFKDVSTIFRSHDHRYFLVGTRYQGLYKSLNPYMRVSEVEREENITDIHMTLQTSFGEHTVQIEVDHPAYLRAQVFDCLGRRVRVLYDCNVEPGIYRLPISVPEIISGLYFLSVSIDDMVKTQPIPLN